MSIGASDNVVDLYLLLFETLYAHLFGHGVREIVVVGPLEVVSEKDQPMKFLFGLSFEDQQYSHTFPNVHNSINAYEKNKTSINPVQYVILKVRICKLKRVGHIQVMDPSVHRMCKLVAHSEHNYDIASEVLFTVLTPRFPFDYMG